MIKIPVRGILLTLPFILRNPSTMLNLREVKKVVNLGLCPFMWVGVRIDKPRQKTLFCMGVGRNLPLRFFSNLINSIILLRLENDRIKLNKNVFCLTVSVHINFNSFENHDLTLFSNHPMAPQFLYFQPTLFKPNIWIVNITLAKIFFWEKHKQNIFLEIFTNGGCYTAVNAYKYFKLCKDLNYTQLIWKTVFRAPFVCY